MSSWNGDYHLNINIQEMYWAMDSVQISNEAFLPLLYFLEQMSITGRDTARNIYHTSQYSDAWISHGFTDNYLNLGLSIVCYTHI